MADTVPRVPYPLWPTVAIRLRSDNSLVDAPNVEIRAKSPGGTVYVLPAARISTGIYRAAALFVCDVPGPWRFEGHSPVIGDLIKSDETFVDVKESEFPVDVGSTLPAVAPTDGNPWASWSVITTDATPTRILRVPLRADESAFFSSTLSARLASGATAQLSSLALFRRVAGAAPAIDSDAGTAYGNPAAAWSTTYAAAALSGISAAFVINADSVDVMVTGKAATAICWTLASPPWTYLESPGPYVAPATTPVYGLFKDGQSIGNGYSAGVTAAGAVPLSGVYMPVAGIVGLHQSSPYAVRGDSSLVTAVEQQQVIDGGTQGETGDLAFVQMLQASGKWPGAQFVIVNGAVNGLSVAARSKGTNPYTNALQLATDVVALVNAIPNTHFAGWLVIVHVCGESDYAFSNYEPSQTQLWTDLNTDLKAISGQSTDIPMVLSTQCYGVGAFNYDQGETDTRLAVTAPTKWINGGGRYWVNAPGDGEHIDAASHRRLGAQNAASYLYWIDHAASGPPMPNQATISRVTNTYTIDFDKAVAIDTSEVSPTPSPELYGFSCIQSNGTTFNTVNSVTVGTGPNGANTRVTVVTATDPGPNAEIRYATGKASDPRLPGGPTTGPRGCLRGTAAWTDADGVTRYHYVPRFFKQVA